MAVLRIVDPIYVPVKNLEYARRWYCEKLGCQADSCDQGEPGTVTFRLGDEFGALTIGLPDDKVPGTIEADPAVPTIFTDNIKKARALLESRGVVVGPIENDRAGTCYFEFRDADENLLEVSEEP